MQAFSRATSKLRRAPLDVSCFEISTFTEITFLLRQILNNIIYNMRNMNMKILASIRLESI